MEATADLIDTGIMSRPKYDQLVNRGQVKVVRPGKGKGCPALIAFTSLPVRDQNAITNHLGTSPFDIVKKDPPTRKIEIDYQALEFFSNYRYPDGSPIPTQKQDNILLWANNAAILNTLKTDLERHTTARAAHGRKPLYSQFYAQAVTLVKDPAVQHEFENNLPTNPRRLRAKLEAYIKDGYNSLIKHYTGNSNARKVTDNLEKLILSLYAMPNKPYAAGSGVWQMYHEFVNGDTSIIDKSTGEIISPEDFRDKNGNPITISEATVWQYVRKPANRVVVERLRNDAHYYKNIHEPHHHREAPEFSLSKVSLDDRDIPESDVKTYLAFDVASGCIIGKSFSKDKDMELVINCFRDMFSFLDKHQLGTPMEVEVEQHLMNRLADTVLAENGLFKYIRWCAPGNSQEKWAETGNRLMKYGKEKKYLEGRGRFYARLEANRPKQVNEWDENGRRVKDRRRSYDKAVAEILFIINKYNNEPHPQHQGKTRLQVLLENVNPKVGRIDRALVARMIGEKTITTIRRSQYVTVQYEKYQLPHPAMLRRLKPNNYNVDAFYLSDTDGTVENVFLYQDGKFICECKKIGKYNTAKAEWDETDEEAYTEQSKFVSQHRKMVKDGREEIAKLTIMENESQTSPDADDTVEVFVSKNPPDPDNYDYDDFEDLSNPVGDF